MWTWGRGQCSLEFKDPCPVLFGPYSFTYALVHPVAIGQTRPRVGTGQEAGISQAPALLAVSLA